MSNPFLKNAPAPADNAAALFAAPAKGPARTDHHGYELPPETREYRPSYVRGKYALPSLDGTKDSLLASRVTSGVKVLDDSTGLMKWQTRQVVAGVAESPALLNLVDLANDSPSSLNRELDEVVDRALVASGSRRASELGTAIHAWIEAVEQGHLTVDDVPSTFEPYVTAYFDALAAAGVKPLPDYVERIVYDEVTDSAGTFDNILELATGERVIGDKKTSKTGSFRYGLLGFAQQLATYARATHILSVDGTSWEPMPPVGDAFGVIAHIPSDAPGKCHLHTIDLEYGRRAVDLSLAVKAARAGASSINRTWELPTIVAAIHATTTQDELAALYEQHAGVWTPELTKVGLKHAEGFAN